MAINKVLSILDADNLEVMKVYAYNFSSELMGRSTLTMDIELPVQRSETGSEIPYAFSTQWHIEYNNDVFYLNSEYPTGVKDNENRSIRYTLVFESYSNTLENIFIKPYGKVYRDENNDGFADDEEVTSDILLGESVGFYGNLYDFVKWLRKNLENIFGYITNESGNNVTFGSDNHIALKYTAILNGVTYLDTSSLDAIYSDEFNNENSDNPTYVVSNRQNIDASGQSFFSVLQTMNEVFTYKQTLNGVEKKIGYTYSFETRKIDGTEYSYYVIIINPESKVVQDSNGRSVIFEYGGLRKGGGLLSITRTTQDNKLPTRIYGNGSGDNLPVNYFYIKEDRSEEIWSVESYGNYPIKTKSIARLESFYANNPDDIRKDKYYLIPNDKFPFVYDKWFYNRGEKRLAHINYGNSTMSIVISSTIRKVDGFSDDETQYILNGEYVDLVTGWIYLKNETDNIWDAYVFDAINSELINLGCWSNNNLGDGFSYDTGLPTIDNSFISSGTVLQVANSEILILVNGEENKPSVLLSDKIYFIVRVNADGTGSFYADCFASSYSVSGWLNSEDTTYERVNPFTKYISNVQTLMPDFMRSYIAGWRYGVMYAQINNNVSYYRIDTQYIVNTDYADNWGGFQPSILQEDVTRTIYIRNDIYPIAYMPLFRGGVFYNWEVVGILETDTTNEFYNKDVFDKGLKDYCIGVKSTYLADNSIQWNYSGCGKIYKPITYYENTELVKKYGVIESRQDFTDIKPTITGVWYKGLGRLDELVGVYIPCLDAESSNDDKSDADKWGKYWLDSAFLVKESETFTDYMGVEREYIGHIYNRKVPDLFVPLGEKKYSITYSSVGNFYTLYKNLAPSETQSIFLPIDSVWYAKHPEVMYAISIKLGEYKFTKNDFIVNGVEHYDEVVPFPMKYVLLKRFDYEICNADNGNRVLGNLSNNTLAGSSTATFLKYNVTVETKFSNDIESITFYPVHQYNINGKKTANIYIYNNDPLTAEGFVFFSSSIASVSSNGKINATLNPIQKTGWHKYKLKFTKVNNTYIQMSLVLLGNDYALEYVQKVDIVDSHIMNNINLPSELNLQTNIECSRLFVNIKGKDNNELFDMALIDKNTNIKNKAYSYHSTAWEALKTMNIKFFPVGLEYCNIDISADSVFDYTTREFFAFTKDIKFNVSLPAFQGDEYPVMVFSTGDLQGIENKFAFSEIIQHGTEPFVELDEDNTPIEQTTDDEGNISYNSQVPYIHTELTENGSLADVTAKYRASLSFILPDTADNQSVFNYLPQRNIKPKAKDLFILENVLYPHNPYVYEAERLLGKSLREALDVDARYTYTIVFDDIQREVYGIDYNQLKVGNKIYIKNNSLVTTNGEQYAIFEIKSVNIQKTTDSLYDKYTLVLKNYTKRVRTGGRKGDDLDALYNDGTSLSKRLNDAMDLKVKDTKRQLKNIVINENKTLINNIQNNNMRTNTSIVNINDNLGIVYKDLDGKASFEIVDKIPDVKEVLDDKVIYFVPEIGKRATTMKAYVKSGEEMVQIGEDVDLSSLLYSKTYDMTDAHLDEDIVSDNMKYDNVLNMFCTTGKVSIQVPRKSTYSLSLTIYDNFKDAYITANDTKYAVQTSMTISYKNVDVIEFETDAYLWFKSITVMETTFPDIPTRLSQLDNDQEFVASKVISENLILEIKQRQD